MIYHNLPPQEKLQYENLLKVLGSLSKLFSDSNAPYLHYRVAENLFCYSFNATNLSRSDISIDAKINKVGLGLKTFLYKNGNTLEKVAEFNKDSDDIRATITSADMIKLVSELRNKRIQATCDITKVDKLLYHCVTRESENISIYETSFDFIDISNISNVRKKNNVISFNDNISEYSFNISKSTLYKRFDFTRMQPEATIGIEIEQNPFNILQQLLKSPIQQTTNPIIDYVVLPLYSTSSKNLKYIPERSGLNQWNANGRKRDHDEVYIPIPAKVHKLAPRFFPDRGESFSLKLPNSNNLIVKVCQDGNKALMSDPNRALGEWLLRDILHKKQRELSTYSDLMNIGIDSVQINKFKDGTYEIDFKRIGSYENFIEYKVNDT